MALTTPDLLLISQVLRGRGNVDITHCSKKMYKTFKQKFTRGH